MQPCFTPAWQVKDSVNLLSILTPDLLIEYMDIKTSKKRPWTPSFLSLSDSFWQGIQSKTFLKSTKREKSKFRCFCGLDFMHLSIRIFNVKMLSTVPCIFLKPPCSAFKFRFWTILLPDKCAGGGWGGGGRDWRDWNWLIWTNIETWGRLNTSPFPRIMGIFFRI